jgi:hypothetical protein
MIPKLPKKTKINGVPWRVSARRTVTLDGEEVDGACHFDKHMIEVAVASEDELTILETFFHEVLHACVDEAGVDIDDNVEHAILRQMEKWLARNCDLRARPRAERKVKRTDGPEQAKQKRKARTA